MGGCREFRMTLGGLLPPTRLGIVQAAGQPLRFPKGETTECLVDYHFRCNGPFQCLCQQQPRVVDAPCQRVRPRSRLDDQQW